MGPFWTEKLYSPSRGQDHLGLGSVSSDQILRSLAPGINVLTVRPRYWSFYSFVLDEFWRRRLTRTRRSYAGFYRPCEAIYSVALQLCDRDEHEIHGPLRGAIGSRKTRRFAFEPLDDYDPMYPYIDADLGGYGLYYARTMAATGLVVPTLPEADVPFDWPSPDGQHVAAAFRDMIANTKFYREYFGHPDRVVPADVVLEYARAGCLCQLQTDQALDRPLLRDVFCYGGAPIEAARRRSSLRFFLDISATTGGMPVDEDLFRRLIYFRDLGATLQYRPRLGVDRVARRWRLYQAREYYSLALNQLWSLLCDWGAERSMGGAVPVPLADWWAWFDDALDFGAIGEVFGPGDPGIRSSSRLGDLTSWLAATGEIDRSVDDLWPHASFNEHDLCAWHQTASADQRSAAAMIAVLLLVGERVGHPHQQAQIGEDSDILTAGGPERLAMTRFFERIRRAVMAGTTVGEFARALVLDYVIRQHERVAMSKLPDDTFRFRREGDRLRFSTLPAGAGFNDSRFTAISTTVAELGLARGLQVADHTLSDAGSELLETGDLAQRPITNAHETGEKV
jgi:hypothetical protein